MPEWLKTKNTAGQGTGRTNRRKNGSGIGAKHAIPEQLESEGFSCKSQENGKTAEWFEPKSDIHHGNPPRVAVIAESGSDYSDRSGIQYKPPFDELMDDPYYERKVVAAMARLDAILDARKTGGASKRSRT